jgi:hypothetical protein
MVRLDVLRCTSRSAPTYIVRNLKSVSFFMPARSRSWRKITGPREFSRIAVATTTKSGAVTSSMTPATASSSARLTNRLERRDTPVARLSVARKIGNGVYHRLLELDAP